MTTIDWLFPQRKRDLEQAHDRIESLASELHCAKAANVRMVERLEAAKAVQQQVTTLRARVAELEAELATLKPSPPKRITARRKAAP